MSCRQPYSYNEPGTKPGNHTRVYKHRISFHMLIRQQKQHRREKCFCPCKSPFEMSNPKPYTACLQIYTPIVFG